jgi:hypothetical protein
MMDTAHFLSSLPWGNESAGYCPERKVARSKQGLGYFAVVSTHVAYSALEITL